MLLVDNLADAEVVAEVFVEPVPPDTGIARRMMLGHQGGRWENLGALARKLSTSPRALSVLTGPLWIAPTKDAGRFDRIDIGLNLKSGNKGLCVADYTRPMKEGNGWEFSQQCVKLLQDYKRAHPWVFAALQSDPPGVVGNSPSASLGKQTTTLSFYRLSSKYNPSVRS